MTERLFDPAAVFRVLNENGVDYVVIGGVAAVYHGAPVRTEDIDITPHRRRENLEVLAAALAELEAVFVDDRGESVADVNVPIDADMLSAVGTMRFLTGFGPLDVTFRPDGTEGYDDLVQRARYIVREGVAAPVAALEDVVRSKEAASRAKDLETLPALVDHLRAIESGRLRAPEGLPVRS